MTGTPPVLKRGRKLKRLITVSSFGFGLALWLIPALPIIQHWHGVLARHRVEKRLRASHAWPTNAAPANRFDAAARERGKRVAMLLTNQSWPWALPTAFDVIAPGVAAPVTARSNVTASWRTDQRSNGWVFFELLLKTNQEHFAAIHREIRRAPHDFGFDLSPDGWEPMEWSQRRDGELWEQLFEGIMGHWRCLHADTLLAIRNGDGERALAALADLISVNDVLRDQPAVLAQTRRYYGARRALALTWLLLHELELSDQQLLTLSRVWSDGDYIRPSVDAFASDLASFQQALENLAKKNLPDSDRFLVGRRESKTTNEIELQMEDMGRSGAVGLWRFLYADETLAAFAEHSTVLKRAAQGILKQHRATEWAATRQELRQSWKRRGTYDFVRRLPMTFFMASVLDGETDDLSRAAELETEIALVRVAIAVERFRWAHGDYPESTQQLMPEYLREVPRDWQTGQPIRYARRGDGFKLYAIGWDGADDGGSVELRAGTSKYQSVWSGKDVVWLQRASKEQILEWEKRQSAKKGLPGGYAGRRPRGAASTNAALLPTNSPVN